MYCMAIAVLEYAIVNLGLRTPIREYRSAKTACKAVSEGAVIDFRRRAETVNCPAVNSSRVTGHKAVKYLLHRGPAIKIDCASVAAGRINTNSGITANIAIADFCYNGPTIKAAAVAVRSDISSNHTACDKEVAIDQVQAAAILGCVAN